MIRRRSHSPIHKLPAINPTALTPIPEGPMKRALDMGHSRIFLGAALFSVAFVTIALRLTWVTLVPMGDDKVVSGKAVHAPRLPRSDILDRNGVVLATSLTISSLYANPKQITNPTDVAKKLSAIFPDLNPEILVNRLSSNKGFAWLKRSLTPKEQQVVLRLGIPGLYFQNETKRLYPQGNLTAHLVGFADIDNKGLAGIERSFDDILSQGRNSINLSLDVRLQHIVHEELSRAITDFSAIGGAGAVLDLQTGEILSMVSLPDFDPVIPNQASEDQRFNRATLGVYEMGSTFKIFNTAIALDTGHAKISDIYDASRPIKIGGFSIDDYHGKHRPLNISEIFTYSSNIGSAKMADQFGPELQQSYLQRFGLLSPSPLELAEIGAPLYPPSKNWRRINTMTISYGHGISVSPMQLLAATGAIVNHGIWREPTLLRRTPENIPDGQQVVDEKTSAALRQLMRLVVEVGTGKNADVPGYLVGGKTGTADKQAGRGYAQNSRMASFIATFPVNNPRFVILIMVDEPKPNAHSYGYATGGWVAAPAVGKIVTRMAPLYGIYPVPEDSPETINPLTAHVADYDAHNSTGNSHAAATKVKATQPEVPLAVE